MNGRIPGWVTSLIAVVAVLALYAYALSAETPVGTVRGVIQAADTERPLAGIRVLLRPADAPGGRSRYVETDARGEFRIARLPAGRYDVTPETSAYHSQTRSVLVQEGRAAECALKLTPGDPYLYLNIHQHAVLPEDNPRIAVQGFRQGEELTIRLFTVAPETLLRTNGELLRRWFTPVSRPGNAAALAQLRRQQIELIREQSHSIRNRDAEGVFYDFLHLGKLSPGVYLVHARGASREEIGWLMVTDLALITKAAQGKVRVFSVNLKTGAAVPNTEVVFQQHGARPITVTTDHQGRAEVAMNGGDTTAIARQGTSVAFMRLMPGGWSGMGTEGSWRYRAFTYTDRPVYRPGDQVRFKGVVRRLEGRGYGLPAPGTVHVSARDMQDNALYDGSATLTPQGSFSGEFTLPKEALGGGYSLTTRINGETHTDWFAVASYRKPEWEVDVSTPRPSYVRGERIPVSVSARYYYGAPVTSGKATYIIYRSEYWEPWDEAEELYAAEIEPGFYGEVVAEGEVALATDGTARFTVPTDPEAGQGETDFQYSIEVNVTDLSDRVATGRHTVRVSAGEFRIDARPSRYVAAPGDALEIRIRVRDLQEQPVADLPLEAIVTRDVWNGSRSRQETLETRSTQTDAGGNATVPLTASETGFVTVKVIGKDRRGNRVAGSANVWISTAAGGDYGLGYSDLTLVPDRKEYRIGDTAEVLINTSRPGALAIVSVEADEVLDLQTLPLRQKSTVVRFPIRAGYEPNVFVTACFVHNREFYRSEALLRVDPEDHRLQVEVQSDRETYRPGETATFTVRTRDSQGRPVPAEASFALVDEAIYAIKPEPRRGLWEAFYPRRYNEVATEFSFPNVYLGDADKSGANLNVRRQFLDTAHWDPHLRTNAAGEATVRVRLPDNLTSWRATVVAQTAQTQIGRQTHQIRVAKELTLRLQVPRILTEGDQITLTAVAHNYSDGPQDVAVELQATGVQLRDSARKTIRLATGEAQRLSWQATVRQPGVSVFTASARAGTLSDGMELSAPVRRFAREDTLYRSGTLTDGTLTDEFARDPAAVAGEAEVRLSPTVAGTLLGALEYLATYPYGCTEQTMSAFLPDVVIFRMLRELSLQNPELARRVPEMVREGLLRLYGYQDPQTGGWGWWQYDRPDPWMTAYVLLGLQEARASGFPINERIYDNGLHALEQIAGDSRLKADDAMFVAYVLARGGRRDPASRLLERFRAHVTRLQQRSLGYRVLALQAMGSPENRREAASEMQHLWTVAESLDGMTWWAERRAQRQYDVPQDVESTAVVLKAAAAVDPQDRRLPEVARWLLRQRQGNRWNSTRDTAWILMALADYLKETGELRPDYRLQVRLNGRELHSARITAADALKPETVLRIPLADLTATNRLEIRKEGTGAVYYSVNVTQHLPVQDFFPTSTVPGLEIRREYFTLEKKRGADGRLTEAPATRPTQRLRVGERVLVRLQIRNRQALEYLMVEDPLPAGGEVLDRGRVDRYEWENWWASTDVRDDRVSLFVRSLPPGTHTLEYYIRPELEGRIRVLPTVLSDMYLPSLRATSDDHQLEVTR